MTTTLLLAVLAAGLLAALLLALRRRHRRRRGPLWEVKVGWAGRWRSVQDLERDGAKLLEVRQAPGIQGNRAELQLRGYIADPLTPLQVGVRVEVRLDGVVVFVGEVCERRSSPSGAVVTCYGPARIGDRVWAAEATPDVPKPLGEHLRDLFDAYAADLWRLGCAPTGRAPYVQAELDQLSMVVPTPYLPAAGFTHQVEALLSLAGPGWVVYVDPADLTWHVRRLGEPGTFNLETWA